MSDWLSYRLDECADILDHLRIPVNEEERSKNVGNTPYYGANGLQGFINGWLFDEPLILMAEDGGYFDEYSTRPVAYRISGKSWVNNHAHILRPKKMFSFDYIFYSLQHKNITPFIKGGTRAKLNQKELREIVILVPQNKARQNRIAEILKAVDEAIEKTETLINKYQQIKAGVMHDLFTRGISADGKLRLSKEQAPELYQETPSGWIPKDWESGLLERFVRSAEYGISTSLSDAEIGIPILRMNNIQSNAFDVSDLKYTENPEAYRLKLKFGDVLYNRTNSMEHVGKTAIWKDELVQCSFASYLVRINLHNDILLPEYFSLWMSQTSTQLVLRRYATPAVQQVNINPTNLQKIWISFPSNQEEQVLIVSRINKIDERLKKEAEKLKKLNQQKSGLMHDLLTGEVPVKLDETEVMHV